MENLILPLLIVLVVLFLLFLLLRELNCWYWKINDIISILRRIEAKLPNQKMIEVLNVQPKINTDNDREIEIQSFKERFSSYTTEKLKKMRDKGLNSYSEDALLAVSKILKERGEQ
jgi:hypothetical protein